MDRAKSVVTVNYVGTPENLQREAGWLLGPQRIDFSGRLRAWYKLVGLSDAQTRAIRWLAARPNGLAKILAISEEWSSDCRRDVPMLAHLSDAGGMELRIFPRDGQKVGRDAKANPAAARPGEKPTAGVGPLHRPLAGASAVAVLPGVGVRYGRRDPLGALREDRRGLACVSAADETSRQLPPAIFPASPVSFTMCRPVFARSAR